MGGSTTARVAGTVLTALAVVGGFALRSGSVEPPESVDLSAIPVTIGEWRGRDVSVSDRVRAQLRSDQLLLRAYRVGAGTPVWALVDYHRTQRLGSTVHSPKVCYPGAGWRVERVTLESVGERPVRWLDLDRAEERMLSAYWYETRSGQHARETDLKIAIVSASLARRPADAALMRLSTPVIDEDTEAARRRLLRFMSEAIPALRLALPFERPAG